MDIKEFKNKIISEINSKLVTLIDRPDFENNILPKCIEHRYGKTIEELVKHRINVIHFPLLMLLNPSHEYTKRYKEHQIRFELLKYYNRNYSKLTDLVDIQSNLYSATYNANRSIETLMSINMAIMTFDELVNFKSNEEVEILTKFKKGTYILMDDDKYYLLAENVELSYDRKYYNFKLKILINIPSAKLFGNFTENVISFSVDTKHINNKMKVVSYEDIRKYLSKFLTNYITMKENRLNKLELDVKKLKNEISELSIKKKVYDNND